jgi:hypothetical protein
METLCDTCSIPLVVGETIRKSAMKRGDTICFKCALREYNAEAARRSRERKALAGDAPEKEKHNRPLKPVPDSPTLNYHAHNIETKGLAWATQRAALKARVDAQMRALGEL